MQENNQSESPKEAIHKIVEMLESTANVARNSHEAVKASLEPEQIAKYEHLSLSLCFALLEASELDNVVL